MEEIKFSISEVGNNSQEQFTGNFKMKIYLSYRDTLKKDQLRRELLGDKPLEANEVALTIAEALSFLGVYITESPSWWRESNSGLDMVDDNIVPKVYNLAVTKLNEFLSEKAKKAQESKDTLKSA